MNKINKLLILGFIIVAVLLVWLLADNPIENSNTHKKPQVNHIAYIEKIENFALQTFDKNQQLSHFTKASSYLRFRQPPALLFDPEVVVYDQQGKKNWTLTAKRAYWEGDGEITFKGIVNMRSNTGVTHKINTTELKININTNDFISRKKVIYLGERSKISAQGMHMYAKSKQLLLNGDVRINQNSGQTIDSKNLIIDQYNEKKHYYSSAPSRYLSQQNTIDADSGFDMDEQKKMTKLLGKVKILQENGTQIDTQHLMINQENGAELYQTEAAIHYQNGTTDIRAIGMDYDAKNQNIKLTGGVKGRYE